MIDQEYMAGKRQPYMVKPQSKIDLSKHTYMTAYGHTWGLTHIWREKQLIALGNEGMKWGLLDENVFAPWIRNLHLLWEKAEYNNNKMLA